MGEDSGTTGQASGTYGVEFVPKSLDGAKRTLRDYQQYRDIMLAYTLKDAHDHAERLELNARPAFVQSPSSVARLMPEERKEDLITHVIQQYG